MFLHFQIVDFPDHVFVKRRGGHHQEILCCHHFVALPSLTVSGQCNNELLKDL